MYCEIAKLNKMKFLFVELSLYILICISNLVIKVLFIGIFSFLLSCCFVESRDVSDLLYKCNLEYQTGCDGPKVLGIKNRNRNMASRSNSFECNFDSDDCGATFSSDMDDFVMTRVKTSTVIGSPDYTITDVSSIGTISISHLNN